MTSSISSLLKPCTKCKCTKPTSDFKKDKRRSDGLSSWCKRCNCVDTLMRQARNRQKPNINNRNYKKSAKGKLSAQRYKSGRSCREARQRYNNGLSGRAAQVRWRHNRATRGLAAGKATLTHTEWQSILTRQNNQCAICGKRMNKDIINDRPERDHIIPLTRGGGLTLDNVQALCRSCNARKGARTTCSTSS